MSEKFITTNIAKIWLCADDIIRTEFSPQAVLTLAEAKLLFQSRLQLTGERQVLAMTYLHNIKSVDHEARVYAASPEVTRFITAHAVIINSPISRIMGNFYLNFNKPPTPTRLFAHEAEAIAWLKQFLGDGHG